MAKCLTAAVLGLALIASGSVRSWADDDGGKLHAVEQKVESPNAGERRESDHRHRRSRGYYGASAGDVLASTFLEFLFYGLFGSFDGATNWSERHASLKKEWYPGLPTVRLEGAYNKLSTDITGYDLNLTAGYLGFGADCDFVHYFEDTPNEQLKIVSPHALIRGAPFRWMQLDLAMGAKVMRGSRTHSGFEFGLPLYFYLGKHAIIDLKTYVAKVGSSEIVDFSAGLSGKWKMLGARAAYRVIDVDGESLQGPQVGLFFQW